MNKYIIIIVSSVIGIISSSLLVAQEIKDLEQFFASTHAFSCDFQQHVRKLSGGTIENSQGHLDIQTPLSIKLHYFSPDEQFYISTGEEMLFYDVDLEQVTIKKLDSDEKYQLPIFLFTNIDNIKQHFTLQASKTVQGSVYELQAKDKDSSFGKIMLYLSQFEKNIILDRIVMYDNFQQVTELQFSHFISNPKWSSEYFSFTIPVGVDVIREQ